MYTISHYSIALLSILIPTFSTSLSGPVVLVIGTRPEAIKMIPVYQALIEEGMPTLLCSTGQHSDLLEDIFTIFNVKPDCSLAIMKPNQDLFHITTQVLTEMKTYLLTVQPSLVLVQGDTTTAMAAALAAFYLKIPVGHIEAGLRTHNIYAPYPEEMNRQCISRIATYHFAPTSLSVDNLLQEGHTQETIVMTGNTVVDALHTITSAIAREELTISENLKNIIQHCTQTNKKIMLLTAHRRESLPEGLAHIFSAIKKALEMNPDLFVIYPMHPNPLIKKIFEDSHLSAMHNICTLPPLAYNDLVHVLNHSDLVATDSGGIQEEAVSLGKPTLVLRNETDRPEGVKAGIAHLVGTNEDSILRAIITLLTEPHTCTRQMIYGNGNASHHIAHFIKGLE